MGSREKTRREHRMGARPGGGDLPPSASQATRPLHSNGPPVSTPPLPLLLLPSPSSFSSSFSSSSSLSPLFLLSFLSFSLPPTGLGKWITEYWDWEHRLPLSDERFSLPGALCTLRNGDPSLSNSSRTLQVPSSPFEMLRYLAFLLRSQSLTDREAQQGIQGPSCPGLGARTRRPPTPTPEIWAGQRYPGERRLGVGTLTASGSSRPSMLQPQSQRGELSEKRSIEKILKTTKTRLSAILLLHSTCFSRLPWSGATGRCGIQYLCSKWLETPRG